MISLRNLTAAAAALAACASVPVASAQETFVTIGTGGQTGVYYQVGGAVCSLVNRGTDDHGIKCTHTTGGSVDNINGIKSGNLDFGVAQSDWQYHAYHGSAPEVFPEPFEELRAVFSVHPEPFTVVARADTDIREFDDLVGNRVNIGNPGSGQRATMEVVMEAKGWTKDDFALASELKSAEQAQALCDDKIDAFVFVVGHPAGSFEEAASTCDIRFIPVEGPAIDKLVNENPYYAKATIPAGMYPGQDEDVPVFGVGATFVSSTKTSEDTVYHVVKTVFENFDRFRRLHPAFNNLQKQKMITDNLSAPLHDGAVKYYKEAGLM
ncbi:MAG: TAXI family TRAP transporter solute-binding subunit [Halofilum sp. (in: g-proteobacteria)]|nr:TAXI family TRAP transporter solute-binding subunit [Halofilum sp. (in: g-proteobacteria)]